MVETSKTSTGGEGLEPFPGTLAFYHPKGNGRGSAVRLELKLFRRKREGPGHFFLEMANQHEGGKGRFDWEHKAVVKLGFPDVCELLAVLEGRMEAAGKDGRGLYHDSGSANTIITFARGRDGPGYFLAVSRKHADGRAGFKGHLVFNEAEAIGLRCVFQQALFYMAFLPSLGAGSGRSRHSDPMTKSA